jgi:hypothetical protein
LAKEEELASLVRHAGVALGKVPVDLLVGMLVDLRGCQEGGRKVLTVHGMLHRFTLIKPRTNIVAGKCY